MEFIFLLACWAFLAFIGVLIAQSKNRDPMAGCAWGCLLGPIGWLVLALQPTLQPQTSTDAGGRPTRKCPFCAEFILAEARVCKHCGRDVEPRVTTQPPPPSEGNKFCPGCVEIIDMMDDIERFEGQRWHHECAQRERRRR